MNQPMNQKVPKVVKPTNKKSYNKTLRTSAKKQFPFSLLLNCYFSTHIIDQNVWTLAPHIS